MSGPEGHAGSQLARPVLRSLRAFLIAFALIALPLGLLAGAGVAVALRQLAHSRETAATQMLGAVTTLVAGTESALRREAELLARDPALIEGVSRGDWATLARFASPRIPAVTRDGFADLVVIKSAAGTPLVQVPSVPPPALPDWTALTEPVASVRLVDGQPVFLAAAPIWGAGAPDGSATSPLGTIVVGRRFDRLGRVLDGVPARPGIVFLAGDRVLASTRLDGPSSGWTRAARAGRIAIGAETFAVRPLGSGAPSSPDGSLWVLVPETPFRAVQWKLWTWLAVLFAVGAATLALGIWMTMRVSSARARRPEHHRPELEALSAIAVIIARGADLVDTAREILDVVRRMARVEVAIVYRLDAASDTLALVTERGLAEELVAHARVRPLDGTHAGEAVRAGRPQVTRFSRSPLMDATAREMAEQHGHRTQVALPIPVGERTWGALVLVSGEVRDFSAEELAALDAVAHQIGLAVERALLQETATARLNRLEAQRQIERHISEQLDLEQLLVIVARSVLRLIGGAFSIVFLREGDELRPRAWAEVEDWIRDVRVPVGSGVTGHVVATGEGLIVNDYPSSPLALPPFTDVASRLLAEPLRAGGRALGVMMIGRGAAGAPFTPDDLSALGAFATQAAVAIENVRLFSEARRNAAEYRGLFEVAGLVGSTLDTEHVLDLIVDRCRALMGVASAGIFKLDASGETLSYERGVGLSAEFVSALRVRLGEGTTGRAVGDRAPAWSADILADPAITLAPETRDLVVREGYRAALSVPILSAGSLHGALSAYWWEPHTPSSAEIGLMGALASQAAIALENARLYEAATARGKRLAALAGLTETLTATLSLEDVLSRVADSAVELFGSSVARLWLVDDDGRTLSLRAQAGTQAPPLGITRLDVGEGLMGRIVASRAPLLVPDLRQDPRVWNVERVRAEGTVSFAGVPLVLGERTLGALCLALRDERSFSDEDLSLLHSLANHAAIAIENARLFAEERSRKADNARLYAEAARQAERMRAVADLGRTLVSTLDVNRIVETVATQGRGTLEVSEVGICLETPATGELRFVEGAGVSERFVQGPALERGEGVAGRAVAEGRPVWTPSILDDPLVALRPETRRRLEAAGTRAVLALPLVRERPFGALVVHRDTGHRFTDSEIEYFSVFASQVAVALDNARLYAALHVRANRLRTLARLTHIVSSSLDANVVLTAIAGAAAEIMSASFVAVYVADEQSGTLELRAASDERMGAALPAGQRRFGEGLVGWVAEHRQPLDVPDVLADPRAVATQWASTFGLRSFRGIPITVQDVLLGVLTLNDPAPLPLSEADESLLESFVSQAAVAIRNTRLYAETARHLEETRALLEVAEILNSTLDPRRVLKQVAIKIAQVCRVDRCTIERWDGDRVVPLMSQFADARKEEAMWTAFMTLPSYPPWDVPAHAQAIETRRPVVIPDTAVTDLIPREWTGTFGHKSYMVVPLIRQDTVIGVMNLDHVERVTPFARWQVDLAMAIGGQLALTIENTRLYGEAQERLRETTTLLAVARALSEPGPPGEVMRRTAREVARAFGADMVGVYLLDAARRKLMPAAGYHVPKHLLEIFGARPFELDRFPVVAEAWRTGRAFWSADVKNDPRFDAGTFAGVDPHSVLFAPTMVRGEPVGALFLVWWGTGREFQPAEVRLLDGVASQVGLAMENAELARQTQQKLEETESLLAMSRTLASTLDLDTLPRQFLRHVVKTLGADSAGMWLLDDSGEWMEPLVGYRIPPERLETLRRLRLSIIQHAFYAEAARTRRPVVSVDARHDERIPPELRESVPHRTQLFLPIIAKDRMLGGFAVAWWETARVLSEGELRMMDGIASQAGVAVENARLFHDNQRRVQELSVLHELSRAVTGQVDQADLLDTIHQQVARLLDVRHMAILLHDDSSNDLEVVLRVTDGARRDDQPRRYPRQALGLSRIVLDTGQPIRTDDYLGECARRGVEPVGGGELPYWLGVPMAASNRTLGVLALRSRDRAFSESDQRLFANIGDLAALALRSARLYEERTRAHAELAAAQDQLVRTEKLRAMGEMASGVAHDFNNVLAAVLGRAQLLLKRVEDPKLRQWIEVIERSALDGARTVRRLQDFTRIRRDHPVVPVDLNQVIQHTLEATESTWRQESLSRDIHIDVTTRLASPLPEVSGDPAELREALTNLILNALDAMPRGGTLTLATSIGVGQVEIAVSDTGSGIPPGIRQKIFDPFFTTKGPKGTGLGLSMTYGILARHGARITVESEEGRGTTFRLMFPAASATAEPAGPPAAPAAVVAALRCLVVDDEEIVAGVLGDMLVSAGHSVEVVNSGRDAIARFGADRFDLVLTDLAMPGITGWEVARAVKDVAPRARVVLVSGFGVEVSPEDLRANGVDLVLAKPLNLQDIESAVALARSGA
jgi:GAF domain-containing protein